MDAAPASYVEAILGADAVMPLELLIKNLVAYSRHSFPWLTEELGPLTEAHSGADKQPMAGNGKATANFLSRLRVAPRTSKLRYTAIDDQFRSGHEGGTVTR
jgi:hypothetical protein